MIYKPLSKTNKIRAPVITNVAPTHSILLTPATHLNDQEAADNSFNAASYHSIHLQAHPLDTATWDRPIYIHSSMQVCRHKKSPAFACILDNGTRTQTNSQLPHTHTHPPSNDTVLLHINTFHNNNILLWSYTVQIDNYWTS